MEWNSLLHSIAPEQETWQPMRLGKNLTSCKCTATPPYIDPMTLEHENWVNVATYKLKLSKFLGYSENSKTYDPTSHKVEAVRVPTLREEAHPHPQHIVWTAANDLDDDDDP